VPCEEYRAENIVGAVSVLVGDLSPRVSELPQNTEIVAYRRGLYSVFAARPWIFSGRTAPRGWAAGRRVSPSGGWPGCRWRPGRPNASVNEGQRR
jgi:hypothetical protein